MLRESRNVNVTSNNYTTSSHVVNGGIEKTNEKLRQIRALLAEGHRAESREIVKEIMMETVNVSPLGSAMHCPYNWSSPLGHTVSDAFDRLRMHHSDLSDWREDIMQIVNCWLLDGSILQAQTDDICNWIGNRISYNGVNCGSPDIADLLGYHYVDSAGMDGKTRRRHVGNLSSDQTIMDDSDTTLWDCGNVLMSQIRTPEQETVGDDSYAGICIDAISVSIRDVVRDYLVARGIRYDDFRDYCVDYESAMAGDKPRAEDYGDTARTFEVLWEGCLRGKKLLPALIAEMISHGITEAMAIDTLSYPWVTPRKDDRPGLREIIRSSVALAENMQQK